MEVERERYKIDPGAAAFSMYSKLTLTPQVLACWNRTERELEPLLLCAVYLVFGWAGTDQPLA